MLHEWLIRSAYGRGIYLRYSGCEHKLALKLDIEDEGQLQHRNILWHQNTFKFELGGVNDKLRFWQNFREAESSMYDIRAGHVISKMTAIEIHRCGTSPHHLDHVVKWNGL